MRFTVVLAFESLVMMKKLKSILEKEEKFLGLKITNGTIVNEAFKDIKDVEDWSEIIDYKLNLEVPSDLEESKKTNLNLDDYAAKEIERLKKELPDIVGTSYITTPYVIRIVLKASLLKRLKQNLNLIKFYFFSRKKGGNITEKIDIFFGCGNLNSQRRGGNKVESENEKVIKVAVDAKDGY